MSKYGRGTDILACFQMHQYENLNPVVFQDRLPILDTNKGKLALTVLTSECNWFINEHKVQMNLQTGTFVGYPTTFQKWYFFNKFQSTLNQRKMLSVYSNTIKYWLFRWCWFKKTSTLMYVGNQTMTLNIIYQDKLWANIDIPL